MGTQQLQMALTFIETATADCPTATYQMAGVADDAALALLATEVQSYSDGYNMTVTITFAATYFASMATDTELQVAFGNEATLTAAPSGAYSLELVWTYDSTASNCDVTGQLKLFYCTTAMVTTATDLDNATCTNIYYDSTASAAVPKYAWTSNKTYTGSDDIATGNSVNGNWYMPKEPSSKTDGETATCEQEVKIELGAASLVAGSVALAAALAF